MERRWLVSRGYRGIEGPGVSASESFALSLRLDSGTVRELRENASPRLSIRLGEFGSDGELLVNGQSHAVSCLSEDPEKNEVFRRVSTEDPTTGEKTHWMVQAARIHGKLIPRPSQRKKVGIYKGKEKVQERKEERLVVARDAVEIKEEDEATINVKVQNFESRDGEIRGEEGAKPKRRRIQRNKKLSLEDQIMHILAVQPLNLKEISARLGIKSGKDILVDLKRVSQYGPPGVYTLKNEFWPRVDVDQWPYTEEEKSKVIERIQKLRIEKRRQGMDSALEDEQQNISGADRRSTRKKVDDALLPTIAPPESKEEYETQCKEFDATYAEYITLDREIARIVSHFENFGKELSNCNDDKREEDLVHSVRMEYQEVKPKLKASMERFKALHKELKLRKEFIRKYAHEHHHE